MKISEKFFSQSDTSLLIHCVLCIDLAIAMLTTRNYYWNPAIKLEPSSSSHFKGLSIGLYSIIKAIESNANQRLKLIQSKLKSPLLKQGGGGLNSISTGNFYYTTRIFFSYARAFAGASA